LLKKYEKTTEFAINKSFLLIKLLIGIHFVSMCSLYFTSIALVYKLVLFFAIIISLLIYINKELNFSGMTIRHSSFGGWDVAFNEHEFQPIEILSSTVVTPYFVFLHFKKQGMRKQAILILVDALSIDKYRELVVQLKIVGIESEDNESI